MMKTLPSKLLCMVLAVLVTFSVFSCAVAESAAVPSNPEAQPAPQEDEIVKDFDDDAYYARLLRCAGHIQSLSDSFVPDVVLVLGSGLGNYAETLNVVKTIPYDEILGWPTTSVAGHSGNLIFAILNGLNIAVMQGRVHYYEGYDMQDVVFPLRVLHILGAKTVILTNAVGAINETFSVGDFVAVEDHLSMFVPSPLIGENIDEIGTRFPGMTSVYDETLRNTVLEIGRKEGIQVQTGVYLQVTGPQYETPAEIRAFRMLGADTVGMSSAVEAIAAVHMGMKVCMINCVTNMAAGITGEQLSHSHISQSAELVSEHFSRLITGLLQSIQP